MILSILTFLSAVATFYFGGSILASNVDFFYIFFVVMVLLFGVAKVAHHSSETKVRVDTAGGLFILFASSAVILIALQGISNKMIFSGGIVL